MGMTKPAMHYGYYLKIACSVQMVDVSFRADATLG